MSNKTFVDTNVLIYAQDLEAGTKHEAAKDILRELWDARTGRSQHTGASGILRECYAEDIASDIQRIGPSGRGQLQHLVRGYHGRRNFEGISNRR